MAIGSARFTPSILDADTLERLFVNRHHHLEDALGRIERASASAERAAKLFVGPRGAGKTHLVSLIYHRAKALPGFGDRFQVAWLPEDLWTIGSLDDLAGEIVQVLEPEVNQDGSDPVAALIEAGRVRGPIVVLVENLDRVLEAIGPEGQRELRGVLENHRSLLLIATSTRLGDELLDQAEPFYGFFDTTTLEPFDVDEAAKMLKRIAELNGDRPLAARLDEPRARRRLATIAHLAGGQPRVWALLASGLTIERLDDLVSTLVERFDDLTPYYQQQLDRLSLNERRAVRALAAADRALTVSDLADFTGIDPRSLSKTITDLRRRGWIIRRHGPLADLVDQRRSYYQLAEPLARLAFQLKESRGQPVRLVVEFLKAWFDHGSLTVDEGSSGLAAAYCEAAGQAMLADAPLAVAKALGDHLGRSAFAWATDPTVRLFHSDPKAALNSLADNMLLELDDAVAAFQRGDPEPLLRQSPAISQLIEQHLQEAPPEGQRLALARLGLNGDNGEQWIPRLQQLCSVVTGSASIEARLMLALYERRLSHEAPADVLIDQVLAEASEENAPVLAWAGRRLLEERDPARAGAVLEVARRYAPPERQVEVAVALEAAYQRTGLVRKVVGLWESVAETLTTSVGGDHPHTLASRNNLARAYKSAGDLRRAIPLYETTLADRERVFGPDHPHTLTSRNNLANAYESAGDLGRAIPLYEATLANSERVLGPDHPDTLTSRNNLAGVYESAGDLRRAIPLYEATLADSERVLGPDHPHTLTSRNNLASAYQSAGDLTGAIPLYEATLADCERVLGPDHPDTLSSRNNRASAYLSAGDLTRATSLYEATLADRERVLGPDHPQTLSSRNDLASAYLSAGDLTRATSLYEATLADRERVLGPDHPQTLTSRNNLAFAYKSAGDLTRATSLYEATLADCERVLGPDHPDTLSSRNNLASAYEAAGDLARAIPLYETTLADCERVFGPDHPDTVRSREDLASARNKADGMAPTPG